MKNIVLFLIFLLFASCANKEKQLVGHWHEFEKGNPDFINCHKITDSTYFLNAYTYGSGEPFKRGIEMKKTEIAIGGDYFFTSDFTFDKNQLIVNDSIYWIKQEDNLKTFIDDFSAGLLVNIHPFETNLTKFDYNKSRKPLEILIYIGTIKKSILNQSNAYSSKKHYIQLNDMISSINDIRSFVIPACTLNSTKEDKILLHLDKDTPVELINQIEAEILSSGYKRNQMYYLTINPNKRVYGYNHHRGL